MLIQTMMLTWVFVFYWRGRPPKSANLLPKMLMKESGRRPDNVKCLCQRVEHFEICKAFGRKARPRLDDDSVFCH